MADKVIGSKLTLDTGEATNSVKSFKQQLKEAQKEVLELSEKFGATSKEAANAAKRAAELKDSIGDAKSLVDAFNPDTKFRALGSAINTVVGGFSALQGALGLIGAESEDVQKSLLKVQSAMAFSQGIGQLQEGVQTFKNLGSVLVNSLGKGGAIGVAIAGVGLLTAAFTGLFEIEEEATQQAIAYTDSLKSTKDAIADATLKVEKARAAFQLARDGVISKEKALLTYNETLGDSLGKTTSLDKAEQTLADNADEYIKVTGLKAQANALFAIAAQKSAEAIVSFQEASKDFKFGSEGTEAVKAAEKRKNELEAASKEINQLGKNLLADAEKIAKARNIILDPQKETKSTGPKTDPFDQIKKDQEDKVNNKLAGIGRVTVKEIPKSELSLQLEGEIKTRHDARIDAQNYNDALIKLGDTYTEHADKKAKERKKISDAEVADRVASFEAVQGAIQNLGSIVGQHTVAGKVLAIATATINTYKAASQALAASPPPFNIIAAAAVTAAGIANVKKIIDVKVDSPGGSSGGSIPSGASVSAPLQLQRPQNQTTTLDANSLNAIGNATSRAYVLETDIANNQERTTRLNRAARLGG